MLISRHLVRRAENLRSSANTVEEFIRGAVLATEALELVGYLTPTLAEQALLLRHEFEVRTEVAFIGTGYHFEIKKRLDELECEAQCAARYYHGAHHRTAQFDLLVTVGTRLATHFQEAGRFEEEQICAGRVRHWNNTLWMARNRFRYLYWPLVRYFEMLLSSLQAFCVAILVWVAGLWLIFKQLPASPRCSEELGKLYDVINAFFGGGNFAADKSFQQNALIAAAVVAGVAHLGVFISHMYSIISRK